MSHSELHASTSTTKSEMKRADKRSSITVLVLGDEGVGKSSLISTFVSRYFSEVVPGIMTRVRLPPDPETSCVTTIVDSQGGDAALLAAVTQKQTLAASGSTGSFENLAALMERAAASTLDASKSSGSSTSGAAAGIENVDSILLVYDLDRVETFFRLENHWLPLVERCYNGKVPVIVAENKVDLYRPSSGGMTDEQALARKRQQIVSLMQRFPFVRQCIKCSAKNLLRVDDIFLKAQQAVLYPFTPPLYDLETGKLTEECNRAFTRIFRIFDKDHDGLLSDAELDRFQRETYHVAVFDRDFAAWKKVVTRNNPTSNENVIQDGRFTVAGFLAIFDVFISQNRLDVVWQALRKFGYDDDLNLHVPEEVTAPADDSVAKSWKLTPSAKKFLAAIFHQFDSNRDGVLSAADLASIFSVLPRPALPPWHPSRARDVFADCFSLPKDTAVSSAASEGAQESPGSSGMFAQGSLIVPPAGDMSASLSQSGISILSAGDSLPSVDLVHGHPISRPLSFLEWMGLWHAISAISPAVTRAELFRLGHNEEFAPRGKGGKHAQDRRRRGWKKGKSVLPMNLAVDSSLRSRELRVLVLGSRGSGKTALLNHLRNAYGVRAAESPRSEPSASQSSVAPDAIDTRSTTRPETSTTFVKLKRKQQLKTTSVAKGEDDREEFVVHLVFTDVPQTAAASQEEHYRELSELFGSATSPKDRLCDLAMLVFDCNDSASLKYVKELESTLLTKETPRVFVGTKADLIPPHPMKDDDAPATAAVDAAEAHCRELDLELPLLISAKDAQVETERTAALEHLARCALKEPGVERLKALPHEEQKRREKAWRNVLGVVGILSVVVVVGVGVSYFFGAGANVGMSTSSSKDKKGGPSATGWIRAWFGSAQVSSEEATVATTGASSC